MLIDFLKENPSIKIVFGLRAQGHLPTIDRMLSEGKSWEEIGREIHWCPKTAEKWYDEEKRRVLDPNGPES